MRVDVMHRLLFIGIYALIFPLATLAASAEADWNDWFQLQISQHPTAVAAHERLQGTYAAVDSRERPLHNPELETEFEREGVSENYRVGITQTIDLWGKRRIQIQQARLMRIVAEQLYRQTLQEKTAQALQALAEWEFSLRRAEIARQQEAQLDTMLNLIQKRQQTGDLGQVEAELTYLSLSQRLASTAQAEAELKLAESSLAEMLPGWKPERGGIPKNYWRQFDETISEEWIDRHPVVASANAEWQEMKKGFELARREARAEPTFGINAGRAGGEEVVALTISIPLNIRNGYSAEVREARQTVLEAEANYRALYRKQQYAYIGAEAAMQEFEKRYQRWRNVMRDRIANSEILLEKQWRTGDLSTTDYLLTLSQRAEGLLAGFELQKQTQLAHIEALLQSGRLNVVRATSSQTEE